MPVTDTSTAPMRTEMRKKLERRLKINWGQYASVKIYLSLQSYGTQSMLQQM